MSELVHFADGPLADGGFAVGKGKHLPDGREVQRWIQALVASNSLQSPLQGDIDKLPYPGQWRGIIAPREDVHALQWFAADMKGCFYLFKLPRAWRPYFVINSQFTSADLDLPGPSRPIYFSSAVIPMGWRNAMGLVQYLHRRALLVGAGRPSAGLPLDREMRKDKPLPVLAALEGYRELWQVYADDLDLPALLEPAPEEAEEIASFHRIALKVYEQNGIPLADKDSGEAESLALVRRLRIDRANALLSHTGERSGKLAGLTWHCLSGAARAKVCRSSGATGLMRTA